MATNVLARAILAFLIGLTLALAITHPRAATTLLPNGEQCFQKASGPISSGSINMFTPSTTTPKNTWQDSGQVTLNTNPIQLDANGCAIIYGTGSYRQQVFDGPVVGGVTSGNLIFDLTTTDTSAANAVFWAGTSGGTPNAITVTDAGFNNTDGSVINFLALNTNTGGTTLSVSGAAAVVIKQQSGTGPVALTAGCITANNPVSVVYSSSAAAFLLLTACPASASAIAAVPQPQGYLTLASASDSPIITTDAIAATSVFYTAYVGDQIPIWNGTAYVLFTFSQLTLVLSGSNLANTIYDVCVFSNAGVPTLVTGPAWNNSSAGAGARGTGAGTPQLQRLNGIWVNQVQITGANGASTFTIAANQCTYVGSILMDATNGQVSNYVTWGTIRKWGVWNAYNRAPINLQQGIASAKGSQGPGSYTLTSGTWQASNNVATNTMSVFAGLAEEQVKCTAQQFAASTGGATTAIAVNWSSGTPTLSTWAQTVGQGTNTGVTLVDTNNIAPSLGLSNVNTLEISSSSTQLGATQDLMILTCSYRG